MSNEGGTIGDLRTIVSAQAVYQSANGGLYGEPECLSVPTTCSYAVTAVPTQPGDTGVRGFCGDANGVICVTPDGSEPPVTDGACPAGCTALR